MTHDPREVLKNVRAAILEASVHVITDTLERISQNDSVVEYIDAALSTPPAAAESNASVEARLREVLERISKLETNSEWRCVKIAKDALSAVGDEAKKSEGRTNEAMARADAVASGSASHENHGSQIQAGVGSERSSPSEPTVGGYGSVEAAINAADANARTCKGFATALERIRDGEPNAPQIALDALRMPWEGLPLDPTANRWEIVALGDLVTVNELAPFFGDWRGVTLKVVGLHLSPDGEEWASVIEGDQRHRGNGQYDGETDGFNVQWLSKCAALDGGR